MTRALILSAPVLAVVVMVAVAGFGCHSVAGTEVLGLVWNDEFDGPAGQSPDSTRWTFDIGTDWGNAQLEYDTDRPVNVSMDGIGNLAITAIEEDFLGREYTSGRINTRNRFARTRGRFEARIKLPVGQGIWPAFWLLGANFATAGWPDCGEIDIMAFNDDFHVFAIDWDSSSITWSVDDHDYMTLGPSDLPSGTTWVFNHDFFIILNVAVGGNYVGAPD